MHYFPFIQRLHSNKCWWAVQLHSDSEIPSPPVLVRIMTFSSSKLSNEQFESRKDGKYARYFPQFIQVLMQCIFIFMNKKLTFLFIEESLFSKWPFYHLFYPCHPTKNHRCKRHQPLAERHQLKLQTVCLFSSIAMPSSLRISEEQINHLASMARHEHSKSGRVFLKNHENTGKWLPRWCALYQNFLFYFESEDSVKPLGTIYLEHSSCERLCLTNLKDSENQVWPYSLCSIFPSLILKDFILLIILLFST